MKQILQNLKTGETYLDEVPAPTPLPGQIQVRVKASAVSPGTERMLVGFAQMSLLGKARARPDLVRKAILKGRRDGWLSAWQAAQTRLDEPLPLGYSCSGIVESAGEGVSGFAKGDRVACVGAGYANHAEFVVVPENLCVKLLGETPSHEDAAFVALGAIALHALRLGSPQMGETVCVIGLGVVGLLAVQMAKAAGCRVMAIDLDETRVELAKRLGADAAARRDRAEEAASAMTGGRGFDLVLVAADGKTNDPMQLAGAVARDRGTVVAAGNVLMDLSRDLYYRKELTLKVSRSYGPGRYDPIYEEAGVDYPESYVRWTQRRNLEEVVRLMTAGALKIQPLMSHRVPISDGLSAYDLIGGKAKGPSLGVVLIYGGESPAATRTEGLSGASAKGLGGVGVLGAGRFAVAVMLPVLKKSGVELRGIASASGLRAKAAGDQFGFQFASSIDADILADEATKTAVILSRHHRHAAQVRAALNAGKHVFVEKPLCLTSEELTEIAAAAAAAPRSLLCVGFNRRFAPFTAKLKAAMPANVSKSILIRVNVGALPAEHWLLDPEQGGGCLVGEGCHFIDWANFVAGAAPVLADARAIGVKKGDQDWSLRLAYADGSLADIIYTSGGHPKLGKERYEVHGGGVSAVIEDFRTLEVFAEGRRGGGSAWLKTDKGHAAEWKAFHEAAETGGASPIPWPEIQATMRSVFAAKESLRSGLPARIPS